MQVRRRLLILSVQLALVTACGTEDDEPASTGAPASAGPTATGPTTTATTTTPTTVEPDLPLTVDEVYARAEATLLEMGITHVVVEATNEGLADYTARRELWLDAAGDRYREEVSATGTYEEDDRPLEWDSLTIGLPDATWQDPGPVSPVRCFGVGIAASELLGCPGPTETSTIVLEPGEPVAGVATVVLVTEGRVSGSDSDTTFTTRLVADAATGLPISSATEGRVSAGKVRDLSVAATYEYEVLDPSSLPADWFDPVAAGLPGGDPVGDLPSDIAAPWLGEVWDSGVEGLPPLALARTEIPMYSEGLYDVTLIYGAESDRYGIPRILIYGWDREAWESVGRPVGPCDTRTVDGREIRVQCDLEGRAVAAFVFDGDRVAEISAPWTIDPAGEQPNPYASIDALVLVATAIEWREPTP